MRDDDETQIVTGRPVTMPPPWGCPAGAACRRFWESSAPAPQPAGNCGPSTATAAGRGTPRTRTCSRCRRRSCRRPRAVRAPLLLRTRSHATNRNAGSVTRLNRSSNRRSGSSIAQRCSLVWISSTRRSARYRAHSSGASVFTNDLPAFQSPPCRFAGPLRHVHASRVLGLLRDLRPTTRSSVGSGPVPARTGCPAPGTTTGGSHVHFMFDRSGRHPALPRQHRHTYAADIRRGLRAAQHTRRRSRLPRKTEAAHCIPAHIRQIRAGTTLTGRQPLVRSRCTLWPC
jgi:hypothetical protein